MEKVKEFFKEQKIYDENFFEYIETRVHTLPYDTSLDWFGCFPIIEESIVKDMRVVVPKIVTKKNLLVNLHEFYHAYEIYNELGQEYIPNIEEREKRASLFEETYILSKKKTK